jgi:adenosine kinase
MVSLVAFCNPLIDATVIRDAAYLEKWGLKNDDAILANEYYQPLVDEAVRDPNVFMTGGGSGQNTLVMAQWLLQTPGQTAIVGAVGPDANREVLEAILNKAGVKCIYQVIEGKCTGCGVILIVGENRSIVASVAASGHFDFERWDTPEVLSAVYNAKVVFVSGYFLRSSAVTGIAVAAEAIARGGVLAIGLASPSVIDSEAWSSLRVLFRVATLIFGNQSEIVLLAKKLGLAGSEVTDENADLPGLVKSLVNFEIGGSRKRIIVCTLGSLPTIACETGKETIVRPIIPIEPSEIVDTNGAGDSFAGGFLASFIKGAPLEKCIDAGSYTAHANLLIRGCSVPPYPPAFT